MAKKYVARFSNGSDSRYVAYGRDETDMPVFSILPDRVHVKTRMRYPMCLRFMPYATMRPMVRMDSKEIERRYGEQMPTIAPRVVMEF